MVNDGNATLEILEQIDSGLYGRVFRARQSELDRVVAVKVIRSEYSHRVDAVGHAKALARVGVHPNVVTVYGVEQVTVEEVKMPAMVMEWLEGEQFGTRLGGPRFSEQEVRRICMGVLDGMERMHEAGIQHGDLHFGNIILLADCHPKIIDIDASQNRSLGRLSDISREGAIASDVDYCRQLVQRAFAHSVLIPSLVNQLDSKLQGVMSLADIRAIVEWTRDGLQSPSYSVPIPPPTPETAERLWTKVQEYIEGNRPASLQGLIMGQTRLLHDELRSDRFKVTGIEVTPERVRERLVQYEECAGLLLPALAIGCHWGDESHWNLWKQCIETAANCYEDLGFEARSGMVHYLDLRQYPPLLLFYASALGAFLNERFKTLRALVRNLNTYMRRSAATSLSSCLTGGQSKSPSGTNMYSTAIGDTTRRYPITSAKSCTTSSVR